MPERVGAEDEVAALESKDDDDDDDDEGVDSLTSFASEPQRLA